MPLYEVIYQWFQQSLEAASPWLFSAALMLIAIGLLMRMPLEKELAWFWRLSRIRKFLVMVAVALFAYAVVPKGDGGNGGAPMRSPRMSQRQLPSAPESANDYYGMFPAWTNAVTNICCSGIKQADTSVLVRVHLPTGLSPAPTGIEVYVASSLETNVWSMIGTAPIVGGTDGTVIEVPYSILPEGGAYRMFFKCGVNIDTDGDGLSDSYECIVSKTDPNHADADIDGDGIPNSGELERGTDPVSEDSDNDGIPDGDEVGYIVKSDTFVWYDTSALPRKYSDGYYFEFGGFAGWWSAEITSVILSDIYLQGTRVGGVIASETGYVSLVDAGNPIGWGYAEAPGALSGDVDNPGDILIAPYWNNSFLLKGDNGSHMRYGVVQDGSYVVEYHDVREAPYSTHGMTYQVIVPAGTGNVVKVSYLSSDIWMDGSNAVVGVQNKRIVTTNGYYNLTWDFAKLGPILPHTTIEYHLGYGTDPLREDTDDDGLDDYTEVFDAHSRPQFVDYDNDGLDDADEYGFGTDPNNRDSDNDGLTDGWEVARNLNPLSNDSDADGVSDSREVSLGTNPLSADTDGDGVSDGDELTGGTDPLRSDTDCDGLEDGFELSIGTNPLQPDTDGDGMDDGWEWTYCRRAGMPRLLAGGGISMPDFDPAVNNNTDTDPDNDFGADPDDDGLSNGEECENRTDPTNSDSDDDDVTDGTEVGQGSDPADATDGGRPNSRVAVQFTFGDPSGSCSEKYRLEITPVSGHGERPASFSWLNMDYGECETRTARLKPGWSYEVRLTWAACKYAGDGSYYPNYDYTLGFGQDLPPNVVLDDPGGIFRTDYYGAEYYGALNFPVLDVVATLYVLGDPRLVFDYDRDGKIDDADVAKAKQGKVFRFWINDDNDSGDTNESENDRPGSGPNHSNGHVDGRCDLLDFTPVWIDTTEVFPPGAPPSVSNDVVWKVRSSCVNAVWTWLGRGEAGVFQHEGASCGYGSGHNYSPEGADVVSLASGMNLPSVFEQTIRWDSNNGVFLIEGCAEGTDLVVEGWRSSSSKVVVSNCANICITPVESMYWFHSLYGAESDNSFTPPRIAAPTNLWDAAICDKDIFFTHGFRVNVQDAHAWGAEAFKRFWQSGSNARFHMFTWAGAYGWPDSGLYYPQNAYQAQMSGGALKRLIEREQADSSKRILMAQSLGNMVACEALREGLQVAQYYMFDAALPSESIDEALRAEYASDAEYAKYVRPEWRDYTNACWASNWYRFFEDDPNDARGKMGWPNRFAGALENAGEVFNYYSSGDPVFTEDDDIPSLSTGVIHWDGGIEYFLWTIPYPTLEFTFDVHSWQKQEVLKGMKTIAGTSSGGWRFNVWDEQNPHTGVMQAVRYSPEGAALAIGYGGLGVRPVFDTSEAAEMSNCNASVEDIFLALAKHVPALSSPVGGNAVSLGDRIENHDLNFGTEYRNGWGRQAVDGQHPWQHSDMKDMAFFYVYKLYEQLVQKGILK